MVGRRKGINVRIPESILRQIDGLITKGAYSDRTDFINRAVYYELYKEELRLGFKDLVLEEVDEMLERRLCSEKYVLNIHKVIHELGMGKV